MVRVRSPEEILQALRTQIRALESSGAAFDDGERWEAIRIATGVHTIVHDASKKNKSLLTHLGAKSRMKFLGSAEEINPNNLLPSHNLVHMKIGGEDAMYLPNLENFSRDHRWLPFSKWWDEPIFSSGENKNLLSRKNLVFGLRNKDGGGHFDNKVHDEDYVYISDRTLWVATDATGRNIELRDLELTSMRQIGWEVLETLKSANLYS
nr:hypothetical protein [uncultured Hyphomonas sp.]